MRQMEETALSIFCEPILLGRGRLNWKSLNSVLFSPSYKPFHCMRGGLLQNPPIYYGLVSLQTLEDFYQSFPHTLL